MKTTELVCANCDKIFQRASKEVRRWTRAGKKRFFCSCSCSAIMLNKERQRKVSLKSEPKTISLQCEWCKNTYEKNLRDYKYAIKKGKTNFFCSRRCAGLWSMVGEDAIQYYISQKDETSAFRYYVPVCRRRTKVNNRWGKEIVSAQYLQKVWESQKGKCPFTGWEIILPKNNSRKPYNETSPYNASLDRIDNSKGYIEGNVRFVSLIANYARNQFSDEQVIEFCKAVANIHKSEIIAAA